MEQITTTSFADAVGRRRIADAVGVGLTAVSNGVVRNAFPASWYHVCQQLAADAGIDCPPSLFQQRPCSQSVDETSNHQAAPDYSGATVAKESRQGAA